MPRRQEAGQQHVTEPDRGERLDPRRDTAEPPSPRGSSLERSAKQPDSLGDEALRAPSSATESRPTTKSCSSWNSWPTRLSASRWFGDTRNGSAPVPSRSGSPSESRTAAPRVGSGHGSSPRRSRFDAARGASPRRRPSARRLRGSGACRAGSWSSSGSGGPPFVDLGVRGGGRVDDRGRRARLVADADEVVEDRLGGELLDDARPGEAAGETGRDDRHLEPFSARATLMPLPPARVRPPPVARCRWPRWKLGTVSVRSRAALRVTVMIIREPSGGIGGAWVLAPSQARTQGALGWSARARLRTPHGAA